MPPGQSPGDEERFQQPIPSGGFRASAAPMMPPRTPTPQGVQLAGEVRRRLGCRLRHNRGPTPPGSPSASRRGAGRYADRSAQPSRLTRPRRGRRKAGAPNLGYYRPSNRFVGIAQPNASHQNACACGAGRRRCGLISLGYLGAVASLKPRPAVNPNAPAPNAQPGRIGLRRLTLQGNAPWNIGPLQRGRRWNPNGNDCYSP